jgi:mannose-6-phosphate isomerase-like protein (cupin superfamily)
MKIQAYAFDGEGMGPVYKNGKWMVGIKNFKPVNAIDKLNSLERHNKTDELFGLMEGSCTLVSAVETENGLSFETTVMERGHIYSIPATLWHNTITTPGTKMVLIEAPDTSMENSEVIELTDGQRAEIRALYE